MSYNLQITFTQVDKCMSTQVKYFLCVSDGCIYNCREMLSTLLSLGALAGEKGRIQPMLYFFFNWMFELNLFLWLTILGSISHLQSQEQWKEEIALTADLGCLLILVICCFAVISSMRSRTSSLENFVLIPVLPAYMRSSGITGWAVDQLCFCLRTTEQMIASFIEPRKWPGEEKLSVTSSISFPLLNPLCFCHR